MNNIQKKHQLDNSNNSIKEVKRKRSFYLWNLNNISIHNKIQSENGSRNVKQKSHKYDENVCVNEESIAETSSGPNFLSKFFKRINSALSKSTNPSASQRSGNKEKAATKIKHHRSMADMQTNYPSQANDSNKRKAATRFSMNNFDHIVALPSPPQTINESTVSDLEDWRAALLQELDATRNNINKKSSINNLQSNHQLTNKYKSSGELLAKASQPSGLENNRIANKQSLAAIDEKLGVIPKRMMIDDWLEYNNIPNPAASPANDDTSYLQQYKDVNNDILFSKRSFSTNKQQQEEEVPSLLSNQLKKQGKMKYRDQVQEKLNIAAARRNELKTNRLREQMDTALFETMHMLRENSDGNNAHNVLQQQQNIEKLFNDNKKRGNKAHISFDASLSESSNDNYSSVPHSSKGENVLIW